MSSTQSRYDWLCSSCRSDKKDGFPPVTIENHLCKGHTFRTECSLSFDTYKCHICNTTTTKDCEHFPIGYSLDSYKEIQKIAGSMGLGTRISPSHQGVVYLMKFGLGDSEDVYIGSMTLKKK